MTASARADGGPEKPPTNRGSEVKWSRSITRSSTIGLCMSSICVGMNAFAVTVGSALASGSLSP